MDSIYFEDPLGLLIELASYRFEPPGGFTHAEVLLEAHRIRVERGDYNIDRVHLADAIEIARPAIAWIVFERRLGSEVTWLTTRSHPDAERQQPHRPDLRAGRRPRVRGGGRVGEEGRAGLRPQGPRAAHPDARGGGAAERLALGELRDHAVPLQQARPRPLLPDRPGPAGDGRQRDVLPDRNGLSARRARHLPGARLPAVRGRGGHLGGGRFDEGEGPAGRHRGRWRIPSTSTARSSWTGSASSAATSRRSPTSAWPRRSSSCARSTTSSRPGPRSS